MNSMNSFNSVYFLSDQQETNIRSIKRCPLTRKSFLKAYIRHAREVGNMVIVRNTTQEDFLKKYSDIYYGNDSAKRPDCEKIYRKVNDCYFVDNESYFKDLTEFNSKIYSAVLPLLGLKTMKMNFSKITEHIKNTHINMDAMVLEMGISTLSAQYCKDENTINMTFSNEKKNIMKELAKLNKREQQIAYIIDKLPPKFNKTLYKKSLENGNVLIDGRLNNATEITATQNVENTNVQKLKISLETTFPKLTEKELGLEAGYSSVDHVNNSFEYSCVFSDTNKTASVKKPSTYWFPKYFKGRSSRTVHP